MRRLLVILFAFAMPLLACDVGTAPTAVPTYAPPPVLQSPILGLNPVTGAPGTVINVAAAGFPEGAKVNLYLSVVNGATPAPVAQSLTIGSGGILSFAGLPGFLDNLDQMHDEADDESPEWEAFLSAWLTVYGSECITVAPADRGKQK